MRHLFLKEHKVIIVHLFNVKTQATYTGDAMNSPLNLKTKIPAVTVINWFLQCF